MNIAVLASTNGSNLPSFFEYAQSIGISCILIVNKPECGAIEKAKQYSVPYFFIDPTNTSRETFDTEILQILQENNINHVFCIGYMRIISSVLINAYPDKIYNIHPSLLPSFAGGMDSNVHAEVLQKGCKISGATLHSISEKVDEGPILLQQSCRIEKQETPESLKQKVQLLEQKMLRSYLQYLKTGFLEKEYSGNIPAVFIILEKNDSIFLIKRANTGYADGYYALPAGHVEENETFIEGAIREAKEEVGVDILPEDCEVVHITHRKDKNPYLPIRIDVFVRAKKWKNEAHNAEPEKCSEANWYKKTSLPSQFVAPTKFSLEKIQQNSIYSEYGF